MDEQKEKGSGIGESATMTEGKEGFEIRSTTLKASKNVLKEKILSGVPVDVIISLNKFSKENTEFSTILTKNLQKCVDKLKYEKEKKERPELSGPELFIQEARDYLEEDPPDTDSSQDAARGAFEYSVELFFQKIGIHLKTRNALEVLSYFAVSVARQPGDGNLSRPLDFAHKLYYTLSTTKNQMMGIIKNIELLIQKFKEFDHNEVKEKLESYREKKVGKKGEKMVLNDEFLGDFGEMKLKDEECEEEIFGENLSYLQFVLLFYVQLQIIEKMSDQDQKVETKRGQKIKRQEERSAGQYSSMPESEHGIKRPLKSSKIESDEMKDVELSKDLEASEDTFEQQKVKLEFFTGVDCVVINTLKGIKESDADFPKLFNNEEAEGYVNQKIPDTVQGCEKLWAAFVSKVALFYEKIGVDLVSHNSVDVLSEFAIEVSFGAMKLHDRNHKDKIFGKKCNFTNTAV
uniref:Uncharacterized protein n=1 Tax=Meloidogyne javanica TaxID=6303 RepID=A0A915N867_MELJA